MTQPIEFHQDGRSTAKLIGFLYNPVAADPAAPGAGEIWTNTTEKRLKYFDGALVRVIATLNDLTDIGRYRGSWDASSGVPTAAGSTNLPNGAIQAGDYWRVNTPGLITGLLGEADLEGGDLIFAEVAGATTAGQFFGANTNVDVNASPRTEEDFAAIALTAGAGTDVVATTLATISNYQILQGTKDLTRSFEVDIDATTPKITITSLSSYTGLKVKLVGNAA